MFKKLKQKIEDSLEGGEGGVDRTSFSPSRFPGSVVRSSSINERLQSSSPQPVAVDAPLSQSEVPNEESEKVIKQ